MSLEKKNAPLLDAVIIGGSYAGLSAALALGRAMRQVVVLDGGAPCNHQAPHSHNFLTRDGSTPAAIAAVARAQVLAYPTVELRQDLATAVAGENNNFTVVTDSGDVLHARKILFASGIKDLLPAIPGFAESWGISVIHCPYCHGYEYRGQPTGILASGEVAFELGRLIRNWTDKLTIFSNGEATLKPEHQRQLAALGVSLVEAPVQALRHKDGYLTHVELAPGQALPLTTLYARVPFVQRCVIPIELGCVLDEGGYLKVDEFQKTSVPGLFAAGDATTLMRAVSSAVAAGGKAGAFLNHELIIAA